MHRNEFEKQVQQKTEGLKIKPSEGLWDRIEEQLPPSQKRRRPLLWLLALLFVAGGVVVWLNREKQPSAQHTLTATNKSTSAQAGMQNQQISVQEKDRAAKGTGDTIVQHNKTNTGDATPPGLTTSNKGRLRIAVNDAGIVQYNNNQKTAQGKQAISLTAVGIDTDMAVEDNQQLLAIPSPVFNKLVTERATIVSTLQSVKKVGITEAALVLRTASPTKKTWELGIELGAGISIRADNMLGLGDPLVPTSVVTPGPVTGLSTGKYAQPRPGLLLAAGLYAERPLSKRWALHTGINYTYQSNRQPTGRKVFDTVPNGTAYTLVPAYALGDSSIYINHFHFVQVPMALQYRLSPSGKWRMQAGIAAGYLLSSNTLVYNAARPSFYKQQWLNRFNLAVQTGISYHPQPLSSKSFGVQFQYNITSLVQKDRQVQRLLGVQLFYRLPLQKR